MKSKTRLTKLLSIMLALAMVVGMLPISALAAGSATATADFSADPTTALALLNDAKTGEADSEWDADSKTLTLNGVNFVTEAATAVKLPDGTTIVLNGVNIIKGGNTDSGDCYGIYGAGRLTIQGTGTLNVTSGEADGFSFGIRTETGVTIKGGAVDATGGTAGSQSFGIYTLNGDLTIEGGNVKATGGEAKESSGLWAANGSLVISGGKVEATGGNVSGTSSGIFAKNVVIKNTDNRTPDVTTRGGEARNSRGIYIVNDGSLAIKGGTLIAESEYALSEDPYELPSAYSWRTSSVGVFTESTDSSYTWSSYHSYVEIRDNTAAYIVSFDANGGSGTMATDHGVFGAYTLPSNGFTAPTGMQFKAWSVGGVEKSAGDKITVTANTTVTAVWENIPVTYYTVTFDSNGGSPVTAQSIEAGQKATKPADPTKDGYDFKGWTLNGSAYDFNTVVNGNITLVATWEQQQVVPTPPGSTPDPTPTPTPDPTPDPTPTPTPTPTPAPAPSNVITFNGESIKPNSSGEYVSKKAKKPSINKLSKGRKSFKVTWKKVSGVSGYQVQYSTSKKFTKKTTKTITCKGNKKFTKTITKLKGKKKYYVRVRTYKTVNGKKVYSGWSKSKAVTTKK